MWVTFFRFRRYTRSLSGPLFVLLIFSMLIAIYSTSYRIGSVSMATHGLKQLELTKGLIQIRSSRYDACKQKVALLHNGQMTAKMALDNVKKEREVRLTEMRMMQDRNMATRSDLEVCQAKKEALLVKRNGAPARNITEYLSALSVERARLLEAIRRVGELGNTRLQQAKGLLGALTRELEERMADARSAEAIALAQRCAGAPARYSIIFDAGSTGSRVHVFRYGLSQQQKKQQEQQEQQERKAFNSSVEEWLAARPPLLPLLRLEHEFFAENHEALSSFADPAAAAASLLPLIDRAKEAIPGALHACAPIELKATAGLRQMGADRAEAVLREVRGLFARQPFWTRSSADAVRILEGREEGPMAWLTVNFLRGTLRGNGAEKENKEKKEENKEKREENEKKENEAAAAPAATIIDLGGGSTQIVMLPRDPAQIAAKPNFTYTYTTNGRTFLMYQHSYEGNGLQAAKLQVLKAVAALKSNNPANNGESNAVLNNPKNDNNNADAVGARVNKNAEVADAFPCFPRGYSHEGSGVANVRNGGTQPTLDACRELFHRYVVRSHEACDSESCGFNGVFQPDVKTASDGPVYAFSYFFDRLKPHMTTEEEITVQDIADIARRVCDKMETAQEIAAKVAGKQKKGSLVPEMECFELSYIFTLVHDGFGFPPKQILHIAKKINGFETSWALGASLISLEGE